MKPYSSSYFFNGGDTIFNIKQENIDKIRNLKSSRDDNSFYCPVMLQWTLNDNQSYDIHSLNELYATMQFIIMVGEMTEEFKVKYNVKPYHESLLRRLSLEFEDYEDIYISTAFKRPFGNSAVLSDVYDELIRYNDCKYNEATVTKIYLEFIDILDAFFKEFKVETYSFKFIGNNGTSNCSKYISYPVHYLMKRWSLDESCIRNNKLEAILQ